MDNRHNLCPHCSSMMGGSIPMLGSRCTCNDTPVTRDGFVPVVAFDMRDARITALETALAAMTAERDSLKDAVHFLNTMNDEQDEWFTRIADDHGGWHEDLPTGEAHIEEIIGNLKKERDARDVAIGVLGQAIANVKSTTDWPELTNTMQAGLFCGVEDRDLRDRYDGARYGYEDALERCEEFIRNAVSSVDTNPLARAAVEGEKREG